MGGTREMYLREKKQYVRRGVKRPEQRGIRVEHRRKDEEGFMVEREKGKDWKSEE